MQAAQEMGVNLKQGYNGGLTFRESGDLSGQMVKEGVSHANSVSKKQPRCTGTHPGCQVHRFPERIMKST